ADRRRILHRASGARRVRALARRRAAMGGEAMSALTLSRIGHAYFGRTVLDRVDLDVGPGEVVALVGPSGSGKSTLVHIAAGIVEPLRGRVAAGYRCHAMVFQEPRLLPWATARDNIAYPLRLAGTGRAERAARVREAAGRAA